MSEEEGGSGLENSFTDLMTSLAVIFILLIAAFMNNAFNEAQIVRSKVFDKMQVQLKEYLVKGVKVESDPKDPLVYSIVVPEGVLEFKVNSADISPDGSKFLSSFIPELAEAIYNKEFRNEISSIVVEGHTDSAGSDAQNLELSQRRCMAVVSKSIEVLKSSSKSSANADKVDYFVRLLSANGRGEQDLIIVDGKEDPQKSRRVVFKVRVNSVEEFH